MWACVSAFVTGAPVSGDRAICAGSAEQVLSDLARFADAGYSLIVLHLDCPSGRVDELEEQMERLAEEVIPQAKGIQPGGEWNKDL